MKDIIKKDNKSIVEKISNKDKFRNNDPKGMSQLNNNGSNKMHTINSDQGSSQGSQKGGQNGSSAKI